VSAPLFDSHCHLDFAAFDDDRDAVVARARRAGVVGMVVAGVRPRDWPRIAALHANYPEVLATVGIHPMALLELDANALRDGLDALVDEAGRSAAVAIGETGFDEGIAKAGVGYGAQGAAVDAHRDAAERLALPVILHILRAHGPALAHLEARGPFPHGGIVHSYSGSPELVRRYVALNLHVSFAGSICRLGAEKTRRAARLVPAERLLVETDAPDQPLHDAVARNEPAALVRIVQAVADARGEAEGAVAEVTTSNARALYGLG
jgi:TatD DNase family protein